MLLDIVSEGAILRLSHLVLLPQVRVYMYVCMECEGKWIQYIKPLQAFGRVVTACGTCMPCFVLNLAAGKYVFRVQEYKGKDSDALLESGATVSFYSENEAKTFMIGRYEKNLQ